MSEKNFSPQPHEDLSNPGSLQEQIIMLGRIAIDKGNKQIPNPNKPKEFISILNSNPKNLRDTYSLHANFLPRTITSSFALSGKEYSKTTQIPFSIDIQKKRPPEAGSKKYNETDFSLSLDPEGNIDLFIDRNYWQQLMPETNFPNGGVDLDDKLTYTDKCHINNLHPATQEFLHKAINNTQAAFENQTKLLQ